MTKRILLVDDDRLLREVIGEFLTAHGYIVDSAEDADHALRMFVPGQYKLGILDYVMPGMNGLQLMRRLMELDNEMYCLIMTGYPTVDSAYKAMVDGVSDYIIKPFQLIELLNVVQRYF